MKSNPSPNPPKPGVRDARADALSTTVTTSPHHGYDLLWGAAEGAEGEDVKGLGVADEDFLDAEEDVLGVGFAAAED
jgi:hypothetical protein